MNAGDVVAAWLQAHGPTLALGATLVLAAGTLATCLHRTGVLRRRVGLLAALTTAVYLGLAAVPLPRVLPEAVLPAVARPNVAPTTAAPPADAALRADAIERALAQLDAAAPAAAAPAAPSQLLAGEPESAAAWPWPRVLVLVYVAGVVLSLLRLLAGAIRLRRLLASCDEVAPGAIPQQLPARTRLLAAPRDVRPFCTGVLRPVIVVPRALLAPSRAAEALAVIRHEAAHVRHGDPFAHAVLALLAIPLFWHPLLWWLARDVRFQGELLADDAAAGAARAAYARALLDLAERAQPELVAAGTVTVFHRPSEFFRRIQMLLQREGSLTTSVSFCRTASHSLLALALVAGSAGLFGVQASAQQPVPAREAELRDTIAQLRADLAALRAHLEHLQTERSLANTLGDAPPPKAQANGGRNGDADAQPRAGAAPLQPAPPTPTRRNPRGPTILRYAANGEPTPAAPTPDAFPPGRGTVNVGGELFDYTRAPTPDLPSPPAYPAPTPMPSVADLYGANGSTAVDPVSAFGSDRRAGADSRTAAATADLASRYLDLVAELELAEANADEQKRLVEAGRATQQEGKRADVTRRTLKRKLALVDKLLAGEIAATEAEIAWLADEQNRVAAPERGRLAAQLQRATMRLEAMRSVR